jgi:hypothetical protein
MPAGVQPGDRGRQIVAQPQHAAVTRADRPIHQVAIQLGAAFRKRTSIPPVSTRVLSAIRLRAPAFT